jgi:hypothetical protein
MSEKEIIFRITSQTKSPLRITIHSEDTVLDLKNKIKMIWMLPNTSFNLVQSGVILDDKQLLASLSKMEATMVFFKKQHKSSLLYWIFGAVALIGGLVIWEIRKKKKL